MRLSDVEKACTKFRAMKGPRFIVEVEAAARSGSLVAVEVVPASSGGLQAIMLDQLTQNLHRRLNARQLQKLIGLMRTGDVARP